MTQAPLLSNQEALSQCLSALGDRLERSLGGRLDQLESLFGGRLDKIESLLHGVEQGVGCQSDHPKPLESIPEDGRLGSPGSTPISLSSGNKKPEGRPISIAEAGAGPSKHVECGPSAMSKNVPSFSGIAVGYILRPLWQRMGMTSVEEWMSAHSDPRPSIARTVVEDYIEKKHTTDIEDILDPHFVLRPSSLPRLVWDMLGMVLIAYDMVMIPFTLAFQEEASGFGLQFMFWLTLMFWTLDLVLNFFTGYYENGAEELRLKQIAFHYIRTWFLLDLVIIGSDWTSAAAGTHTRGIALFRIGKSVRALRIVRTFRLLRLIKLRWLIEHLEDYIATEQSSLIYTVVKQAALVVAMNHIVACIWYGLSTYLVGNMDGDDVAPWVLRYDLDDRSVGWKYFTALHWSLIQFTPASMEVVPQTTEERVFAVCILLFAMLVFASFVSGITTAMTTLRRINKVLDKNVSILRRYLKSRRIKPELASRVIRYAEHQLAAKQHEIPESDVRLLKVLSKPLQMELCFHTFQPRLIRHPLFQCYSAHEPNAMLRVCNSAVKTIALSKGDTLFTEGASDTNMYVVMTGLLLYVVRVGDETSAHSVYPGTWCGEAALWTEWVHSGTAVAKEDSEVLSVLASEFAELTHDHRKVAVPTARYARLYIDQLNKMWQQGMHAAACGDLPMTFECAEGGCVEDDLARSAFPDLVHPELTSASKSLSWRDKSNSLMTVFPLSSPGVLKSFASISSIGRQHTSPPAGENRDFQDGSEHGSVGRGGPGIELHVENSDDLPDEAALSAPAASEITVTI